MRGSATPGRKILPIVLLAFTAACGREVRVGAIVSRTGPAASVGEKVWRGIEIARDEYNENAGLFGRRVEVFPADDATHPEVARTALDRLVSRDGVGLVVGAVTSPVTLALAKSCEPRKIVLVSPTASAPEISEAGTFVFRVYPSDTLEAVSMADFARDLGLRRVAIFASDDAFGSSLRDAFGRRFVGERRQIVASYPMGPEEDPAYAARVAAIVAASPGGVYLATYGREGVHAAKSLRDAGYRGVLLGTAAFGTDYARATGAAGADTVFPRPAFDPADDDPVVRAFVARYRERFGEDPDTWAAHGYDALRVLLVAVDDAGSTDPDAVRRSLDSIRDYRGAAGPAAFDPNGDVVRYPRLYVVRGGEELPYDRFVEQGGTLPAPGR